MSDFARPLRDLTKIGATARAAGGQAVALTLDQWVPASARHPGQELAYKEFTAAVSIITTTEGTATTVVTATAFEADGKPILIEFFAANITRGTTNITIVLKEDGTAIAWLTRSVLQNECPGVLARRLSPTPGLHTYSVAAYVDAGLGGSVNAGAGGAGTTAPGFIRITRAAGGNE